MSCFEKEPSLTSSPLCIEVREGLGRVYSKRYDLVLEN